MVDVDKIMFWLQRAASIPLRTRAQRVKLGYTAGLFFAVPPRNLGIIFTKRFASDFFKNDSLSDIGGFCAN